MRGIAMASALGAFTKRSDAKLAVLDHIDSQIIQNAKQLVGHNSVDVKYSDKSDPVFVRAIVSDDHDEVAVTIEKSHSNITSIIKNGIPIYQTNDQPQDPDDERHPLLEHPVAYWIELIDSMNASDLEFLLEAAEVNHTAALNNFSNPEMSLGPSLKLNFEPVAGNCSAICETRRLTGAASEARMMGMQAPIMAITGSGNHGITNFLGTYAMAKSLDASSDKMIKSLAITSMITIYIKEYTSKLTAFCGCAIAPATGLAASGVYLLGGTYADMENAMQSVIGTFAGLLCDGAKESCAFKVSTVASAAVQFAYLAMQGAYIPKCNGIVGKTIEDTFANLGILNNPGMSKTDEIVTGIIPVSYTHLRAHET